MRSLRLTLPISLLCLLATTTANAATVPGQVVLRVGDTPMGVVGTTVNTIQPAFAESDGTVALSGTLLAGTEGFIFRDGQVIFRNTDEVAVTLTGVEATIGTAAGDLFIFSPNIGSNDALYANDQVFGVQGQAAPGVPGVNANSFIRPTMIDNGAMYWLMLLSNGNRALVTSPDGTLGSAVEVLQGGDTLGIDIIDAGGGIDSDYQVSFDGSHRINVLFVGGGQQVIAVDDVIGARELLPADASTNWAAFTLVSINNAGTSVFAGTTDGAPATDTFIARNGTIILREGATVDGVALPSGGTVGLLTIDDTGNMIHKWSGGGMTETVFYSCGLGNVPFTSHVLLAVGDLIDVDDDGVGDVTITNFEASSADTQRGIGNDGSVYLEVDLDGGAADEAIVEVTAPSCCGNAVTQTGEDCDDGNVNNTDDCVSCADAACGDGFIQSGVEDCDDGMESATCDDDCTPVECGDGVTNEAAGEDCDDANDIDTDDCIACVAAACGDGFLQDGVEECDDANGDNTDACVEGCLVASCGDGFTQDGVEDCDDAGNSATCDADCTDAVCGDGTINGMAGETCDDMGKSPDCDGDCTVSTCGDGHVNAQDGEECDGDGAGAGGQTATCDDDCTDAVCGDTVINDDAGETCDDGNTDDGDGCDATCQVEGGTESSSGSESGSSSGETTDTDSTTGDESTTGEPTDGSSSSGDDTTDSTTGTGSASATSPTASGSASVTTGDDTDTDTDGGGGVGNDGCGCTTDGPAKPLPAALLGLLFLGLTRRRRAG